MNNRFTVAPILIFSLTVLISSIFIILNIKAIEWSLIISIAIVILIGIKYDKKIFISCLICIVISIISILISEKVYDISYDGMYFHKEAVRSIANGWNPLRTSFSNYSIFGDLQNLTVWLDNYPKGVWSIYACVYNLFHKIEACKGVNIIFVLMLFYCAYDVIKNVFRKNTFLSCLIAIVFTLNPVIVAQFLTFMNDLPVAVMIMICAFLGMKIYSDNEDTWDYIAIGSILASSFAVKFTAPVFCCLVILSFIIAKFIKSKGVNCKKILITLIISTFIGIFVMGFEPYIKHIVNGQHPVYPLLGEEKYDIINTNAPKNFDKMSNIQAMIRSILSKAKANPREEAILKIPFSISNDELIEIGSPDTRISGFGVWFSGLFILTIFIGLYALFKNKDSLIIIPALIIFILLALFFPETWWARYNPYIYYIPCLLLLTFSNLNRFKIFTIIVCFMFIINSGITGICVFKKFYTETQIINTSFNQIKQSGKHVVLRINDFPCHEIWFKENKLDYDISLKSFLNTEHQIFYKTSKYFLE